MTKLIEVLIVEDDARIAEIHRRFTEKIEGFQVVYTAANGEQAMEWLELIQPQLVLLDVYLPDMKGTELVEFIRQDYPDIDIIMITAASEVQIVRKAFRGGVFDYIVKPLTFDRFKESLLHYKSKLEKWSEKDQLSREEIERLWNRENSSLLTIEDVPKGIDPLTLEKILKSISEMNQNGMTAEEVSKVSGVSRSTARRYLEHLISKRRIYAELRYGNVGRPERRYFIE
ncbi:response regulator [Bacillus sp. FJAT-29937]|uniref:response regulator n=1 Tax=Bacillus sp. FJAT-29937 TaxID=1720553 RepID=UPI000832CCE1|nr:response regulator [Bacillus sp. FJAT-29937]